MTHRTNQHRSWSRITWTLALGVTLLTATHAEAQWGWGGWGGWGGYGGYGGVGIGRYGMSLSQLNFFRMQAAARNASRYNLNNAEAATAYQAANLYRQAAIDEMLNNRMKAQQFAQSRFDYGPMDRGYASPGRAPIRSRTQAPAAGEGQAAVEAAQRPATFNEMIAQNGEVFWPLGAPDQGELGTKRSAASAAIQDLIQQSRRGPVSVRRVVQARNALSDYAVPAAQALKQDRPDDVDDFATYIKTLDAGLRSLALNEGATRPASPGGTTRTPDIKPDNAPESAGEVLEKKIDRKTDNPPR